MIWFAFLIVIELLMTTARTDAVAEHDRSSLLEVRAEMQEIGICDYETVAEEEDIPLDRVFKGQLAFWCH